MKTYIATKKDIENKKWVLIDAKDVVVGRLASYAASLLRGKNKPCFTPFLDVGDNVIIINADKVSLSGNKYNDKKYYWHTGYPGGIKERNVKQISEGKFPERIIQKAIKRMLPSGPLGKQQFSKLRVYCGEEHPHVAQNPAVIDFASMNEKNKIRR